MSRSTSPFVEISLENDAHSTGAPSNLTTRLLFLANPAAPAVVSPEDVALATLEAKLELIQARKDQLNAQRRDLDERFNRLLTDGAVTDADGTGATAPAEESDDVIGSNHEDDAAADHHFAGLENEISRLSAMSLIADESLTTFARQMSEPDEADQENDAPPAALATPQDAASYLAQLPAEQRNQLEAEAQAVFPDYNPDDDLALADMQCAICAQVMNDPAALFDQVYDFDCVYEWVLTHKKCPTTNRVVAVEDIRRNVRVKNTIDAIQENGRKEVARRRKDYLLLLAARRMAEASCAREASGGHALRQRLCDLKRRLDATKVAQQAQRDAAARRTRRQREIWQAKFERQQQEFERQAQEVQRHRELVETVENVAATRAEAQSRQTKALQAALQQLRSEEASISQRLHQLDQEERDAQAEFAQAQEAARLKHSNMRAKSVAKRALVPGGTRCYRCGVRAQEQIVSHMLRCFRCDRTCCYGCCQNVGAVVVSSQAQDDDAASDSDAESSRNAEHVIVGNHGLRVYAWRRICCGCYNTCLRARYDIESQGTLPSTSSPAIATAVQDDMFPLDTSELTEDGLTFLYVLTAAERESWRYITAPSSIPRGLLKEWKVVPQKAAVFFDETVKTTQEELLPALSRASASVLGALRSQLTDWGVLRDSEEEPRRLADDRL